MYSTSSVWILNLECKVIRGKKSKAVSKTFIEFENETFSIVFTTFLKSLNDKKYDDFKPLENMHP